MLFYEQTVPLLLHDFSSLVDIKAFQVCCFPLEFFLLSLIAAFPYGGLHPFQLQAKRGHSFMPLSRCLRCHQNLQRLLWSSVEVPRL